MAHRAQARWYSWGGRKSASEQSVLLTQGPSVDFYLAFPLPTWGSAPKGQSAWFVCSPSEALVRSRYCSASREASGAPCFVRVLGVTLYPRVPDFIKFFLLQLLVLFSNCRVRNSLGVSLLQRIFVHRFYVGLMRVGEELQSCIQVTVSLLVICLL